MERALELLGEHLHPGSSVLEIGTRNTDGLIALRGIVKSSGVVHGIALSEIEVWQLLILQIHAIVVSYGQPAEAQRAE